MSSPACPECGGHLAPRSTTGFWACRECGKLVIAMDPGTLPDAPTRDEDLSPAQVTVEGLGDVPITVPDYTEVMVGWRSWEISLSLAPGELPVLGSVSHRSQSWPAREPTEAFCDKRGGSKHEGGQVPLEQCTCGLYSAKTRKHLQSMNYHTYDGERNGKVCVIGTVSLWGKVIEGTQGWRSQFGYPRELFVPFEAWQLAAPLTEAYGVPVRLNNILSTTEQQEV